MDGWQELLNILILLSAALLLGTVAEKLRQRAIIGYLIAGMIVGPNVMGWVGAFSDARIIIELGAALLLFSIGLEFSFRRLVRLGGTIAAVGVLQLLLTMAAGTAVSLWFGLGFKAAVVIGAAVSLSSTASVFRLLNDFTMMDSLHGRAVTGVLLIQDVAVVPLVLVITAMSASATAGETLSALGRTGLISIAAFIALFVVLNYLIPRALNTRTLTKNRELPILLAVVVAFGSALGAHRVGISPAFGSFLAGMLLAESPFATQIRADISSVRTVLVTLFFAAVGMYADPGWIGDHIVLVIVVSVVVLVSKSTIVSIIMLALRQRLGVAVSAGLCLSQIGEFSFVLANIAFVAGILGDNEFKLIVSVTLVTLIATPYLVGLSPRAGLFFDFLRIGKRGRVAPEDFVAARETECGPQPQPIIIVGFGPAGRRVLENLAEKHAGRIVVIDINPKNAKSAKAYGVDFIIGDAGNIEVLERVGIRCAEAVVITLPDPDVAQRIILLCRDLSPGVRIVSRVRYDIYAQNILKSGANAIVNEEEYVGTHLAEETVKMLEDK